MIVESSCYRAILSRNITMAGDHVLRRLQTITKYLRNVQYSTVSAKPTLHLSKNDVLIDEKVRITVKGLARNQKVTLHSFLEDSSKLFAACGHYVANEAGEVDTFQHSSLGGSFEGLESMGLFWGMEYQNPERPRRILKEDVTTPFNVKIAVHDGFLEFKDLPWSWDFSCLTHSVLRRHMTAPGVQRIPVRENGLYGSLFLPPGEGPFPAVLDISGLAGGVLEQRPPLLASHGVAGLSLGYVNMEGLPKNEKDLDYNYFLRAYDWLAAHPLIDANAMGGVASCVGGGYLGVVAMKRPSLKCFVSINNCYNPVGVNQVIEGEEVESQAFRFDKMSKAPGGMVFKTMYEDDPELTFTPIWRHGAKVLQIHGLDDQCVHPDVGKKFQSAIPEEFRDNFSLFEYPDTGHLIEPRYMPLCKASYNPIFREYLLWGGKPKPHADAQEDIWSKILNFLHEHLKSGP